MLIEEDEKRGGVLCMCGGCRWRLVEGRTDELLARLVGVGYVVVGDGRAGDEGRILRCKKIMENEHDF